MVVEETKSLSNTFVSLTSNLLDHDFNNNNSNNNRSIDGIGSSSSSSSSSTSPSSSSLPSPFESRKTKLNNSTPTRDRHLRREKDEDEDDEYAFAVLDDYTIENINIQARNKLFQYQKNITDERQQQQQQTMNRLDINNDLVDGDSDDDDIDEDLVKTLSQLHTIIPSSRYSSESDPIKSDLSRSCSIPINQENILSVDYKTRPNEKDLVNEPNEVLLPHRRIHSSLSLSSSSSSSSALSLSSSSVNDRRKKVDEEQEKEKTTRKNHFHQIHKDDDDVVRNDKKKEKYQREEEEKEEKDSTTHFSFTSPFDSTKLFNIDESQLIVFDSTPIVSSTTTRLHRHLSSSSSSNLFNDTILFTNQLSNAALPKTTMNENNHLLDQTTSDLFDPYSPTTTNMFDNLLHNATTPDVKQTENSTSVNYNFDDLWNQSIGQISTTVDPNSFSWETFLAEPTTAKTTNVKNESPIDESNDLTQYLQWLFNHFDDSPVIEFVPIQNLESIIDEIRMSVKPFEPILSPPLHPEHTVPEMIHHDLFPIVESERSNLIKSSRSDEENRSASLFENNDQIKSVAEKLVTSTLNRALDEINRNFHPIEHFVEQILAQAVLEVYEDESVDRIDDDTSTLSEYLPPSIITNPNTPARLANNLMKYSLTAPVFDDSGDDSSMIEDYLSPAKVIFVEFFGDFG